MSNKQSDSEILAFGDTSRPSSRLHVLRRWMQQIARNVTMEGCGALRDCRYLLHDRATKYTQLNAYAEHWVKSV
jgi:hypothetical protein